MEAFQERLKTLRVKKDMTQEKLGKIVGMKKSNISKYERGELEPSLESVLEFAKFFNVTLDYLLGRTDNPSLPSSMYLDSNGIHSLPEFLRQIDLKNLLIIPVYGEVKASEPFFTAENIIGFFPVDTSVICIDGDPEEYISLKIKGDSMEPIISDGDLVLAHKQSAVDNGDIAVVLCEGDEAAIKRVYLIDGNLALHPENKKYEPIFKDAKQCKILGKVMFRVGNI